MVVAIVGVSCTLPLGEILQGGAVLLEASAKPLHLTSDKVVITIDLNEITLNRTYEKYLGKLYDIKNITGTSNVLEEIINRVVLKEKVLENFIMYYKLKAEESHIKSYQNRQKRQLMIGGLAMGLLAEFGLSEFQMSSLSSRLDELNKETLHSNSRISMLSKAINYNSQQINKVVGYSKIALSSIKHSLKKISTNFDRLKSQVDTLGTELLLLNANINLDKLIVANDKLLNEIKLLFEGVVGSELLTSSLKMDICNQIKAAGHKLMGGCSGLEHIYSLISVTHTFASPHILFFLNIPIIPLHVLDNFRLFSINTLPINYKNISVMLDLGGNDQYMAIGDKYSVNINTKKCLFTRLLNICDPASHYVDFKEKLNCMSSIIENSTGVFKYCNFKQVKQGDFFIKSNESYYYSVKNTRHIEIFCPGGESSNLTLAKMGKIQLKNSCYGKSFDILLEGSSKFAINKSIDMGFSLKNELNLMLNIGNLKIEDIEYNSTDILDKVPLLPLDQPDIVNYLGPTDHLVILYLITAMATSISGIACACFCLRRTKCIKKNRDVVTKNASSNLESSTKLSKNDNDKELSSPPTTEHLAENYYMKK